VVSSRHGENSEHIQLGVKMLVVVKSIVNMKSQS